MEVMASMGFNNLSWLMAVRFSEGIFVDLTGISQDVGCINFFTLFGPLYGFIEC